MKVIIIGGIAAGMSAAAKFKRLSPNDDVVVYEKGDIVSFGACGLPYYVGGFFDDSNEMIARTPEAFREAGVEIHTKHEVTNVDFSNKKVTVKNLNTNEVLEEILKIKNKNFNWDVSKYEGEIDRIVYGLYQLTEEIGIIEEKN